jgi:hypothetical protein
MDKVGGYPEPSEGIPYVFPVETCKKAHATDW